jgi:GntR family transcriptional regulator
MKQIPLLDHDSFTSLHQKAEYQLRKLISDKKYAEGDLFPQEMELAKRWGISYNTFRQVIVNMVRDGLLERKKYLLL